LVSRNDLVRATAVLDRIAAGGEELRKFLTEKFKVEDIL
jgi:hypothetical protein